MTTDNQNPFDPLIDELESSLKASPLKKLIVLGK
jgi:hypothetical protein